MTETEIMTETGIETGIEKEIETGIEIGIEKETGIVIEPLTKLHAVLRDGEGAPHLRHPHPMRGAADALRNGKYCYSSGTCKIVSSKHKVHF